MLRVIHPANLLKYSTATNSYRNSNEYLIINDNTNNKPEMFVESDGMVANDSGRPPSPTHRRGNEELFRMSTFETYTGDCDEMELINAGFYYLPETREIKCYGCGNRIRDIQPNDDFHSNDYHRNDCIHNFGDQVRNITIEESDIVLKHSSSLFTNVGPIRTVQSSSGASTSYNNTQHGANQLPANNQMAPLRNGDNSLMLNNNASVYPQENKRQKRQFIVKLAPNSVLDRNFEVFLNHLDLSKEVDRRKTFESPYWIFKDNPQLTINIAKCGFFYLGNGDRTQCFSCNIVLKDWKSGDNPMTIHMVTSTMCKMVLRNDQWNVPLGSDVPETNPSISSSSEEGSGESTNVSITIPRVNNEPVNPTVYPQGGVFFRTSDLNRDTATTNSENSVINPIEISEQTNFSSRSANQQQIPMESSENTPVPGAQQPIQTTTPNYQNLTSTQQNVTQPSRIQQQTSQLEDRYPLSHAQVPLMRDIQKRRESFTNSPHWTHNPQLTSEIVETGFYSLGFRDNVRCWYCGVEASNFQPNSRPWEIHVLNYPTCNFILSQRGPDFVEAILSSIPDEFPTGSNQPGSLSSQRSAPTLEYEPVSLSEEVESGPVELPPPIVLDPDEEVARNRQELLDCMESDMVAHALTMGFPRRLVRSVLKRQIQNHSCGYQSFDALLDGIINVPEGFGDRDSEEETSMEIRQTSPVSQPGPSSAVRRPTFNVSETSYQETEQELKRLKDEKRCKVCLDGDAEMVFVPCGHLCCCLACTRSLRQCPICRTRINKAYRTYSTT